MSLVLAAQTASTFAMVGIIWFVQIVHYPLFGSVGASEFAAYSRNHARLTLKVVGPPMLVEAASTIALALLQPPEIPAALIWTGLLLLAAIWLSTALLQSPVHRALGTGYDATIHRTLVLSNWLRTTAWTIRGIIVISMLFHAIE